MTELAQKQIVFARYVGILLDEFPDYCFTFGEAWRSPETCEIYAKTGRGIKNSLHPLRLAIDLNLWIHTEAGTELAKTKREYLPVAEYWKELPQLYPENLLVETCWGGDFAVPDIYHFSVEHLGVR